VTVRRIFAEANVCDQQYRISDGLFESLQSARDNSILRVRAGADFVLFFRDSEEHNRRNPEIGDLFDLAAEIVRWKTC